MYKVIFKKKKQAGNFAKGVMPPFPHAVAVLPPLPTNIHNHSQQRHEQIHQLFNEQYRYNQPRSPEGESV